MQQKETVDRQQLRKSLLIKRKKLTDRVHLDQGILLNLKRWLKTLSSPLQIAVYWPIQGEFDILKMIEPYLQTEHHLLLPVVQAAAQPLVFAPWTPSCEMKVGAYGIPIPVTEQRVVPDVVIMPCLGFGRMPDSSGRLRWYRLGYGGGFYDRTLADLRSKGWLGIAIGIAYAASEIDLKSGWKPSKFDECLDVVLTEY